MTPSRRAFLRSSLALAPLVVFDPQELIWKPEKAAEKELKAFVRQLRKAFRHMYKLDDDASFPLFGSPVHAAALTTETELVPLLLQQAGSYLSLPFTVPPSVSLLRLYANIGLSDKLSTGLTCAMDVQHSTDGGASYGPLIGAEWTSYGPEGYHRVDKFGNPIDNPDPSTGFNPTAYVGDLFRVAISFPQPLTIGDTVAITTG